MNSENVLVSIVVQMHNAEDYVSTTLESLLREREASMEIIVVNDKSTDASLARVLAFSDKRIRVIDGPGRGIAACMNTGLAAARGTFIMRCDADDLYVENRIARQVAWLNANPAYAAVCGMFSTIDSKGRLISELQCGSEPVEITEELRQGRVRTHLNTYAIRAESLRRTCGFREFFEMGGDIDLQLRLGEIGRVGYVPENCYFWRLHRSSIVHSRSSVLREFFERSAGEFQKQRQVSGHDDLERGCPPSKPEMARLSPASSADAHIQGMLIGRAWQEHAEGRRLDAVRTGLRALFVRPSNSQAWKSLIALLIRPLGPARKR